MGRLRAGGRTLSPPQHRLATAAAYAFAGGCAGGLVRYAVVRAWPSAATAFPWSTFAVNCGGAFVLGLLLVFVEARRPHHHLRPLLGTGFCGALTTFGSVVLTVDQLLARGRTSLAVGYLAATVIAALAAAGAGYGIGAATWHQHSHTIDFDAEVDD